MGTGGGGAGPALSGPTVDELFGLNGFIDDPVDKLAAIGNLRHYLNWSVCDGNGADGYAGYPNNQLEFSLWGGFWDFDAFYKSFKDAGVLAFPCLQGGARYIDNYAMPPVNKGASDTDPASYAAHADFMFQFAARYGKTSVDTSKLKLKNDQKVASGLGYLAYFENGNEPDADWVKPDGSTLFSPAALAAMSSADYDGHQGKLGTTVGLKNADPGAKMVLAGLAGGGDSTDWATNITTYLEGVRTWATANRSDGSFPADVINVHYYCFGPDGFGVPNPKPGISPEECHLAEVVSKIAAYRDSKLPGKEVWLTEFGYDTHPKSNLRAPAIGGNSAAVVQGQWLVRSYLALMASGIDRAFLFVSRESCTGDDTKCPSNNIQFSTSGVLTGKGDEQPKTSWYFLTAFRSRLGSMHYLGTSDSGNEKVSIARFFDPSSGKGAYVVWAPTSDASVVDGYALHVADAVKTASIVTLVDGSATGTEAPGSVSAGSVSVKVTETPTIVLVDAKP
ncbi:Hypothetical protein A7982_06221 [Minicystis rosea]|nr:Hypothetical protein A7982_06221 [Minicystis rosea]